MLAVGSSLETWGGLLNQPCRSILTTVILLIAFLLVSYSFVLTVQRGHATPAGQRVF